MDPIIMIGVPPVLIAVIAVPLALVLGITVGGWNYRDRCEAEDAAAAAAAASESDGADA